MSAPRADRKAQLFRFRWEQALRTDERVKRSDLLVLLMMGTYSNPDGSRVTVGEKTLENQTGVGTSTVRRAITRGIELGYLERTARGHRLGNGSSVVSRYQLVLRQPLISAPLTQSSTDQPDTADEFSTDHSAGLNRSNDESQPVTTTPLPGVGFTKKNSPAAAPRPDMRTALLDRIARLLLVDHDTATAMYRAWHHTRSDLRSPIVVLTDFTDDDELIDMLEPFRPVPLTIPCPDCGGLGKALHPDTGMPGHKPCSTCNGTRRINPPAKEAS